MEIWIINKIITAYILSTLTILGLFLIRKTTKERRTEFLNLANLIIIVTLSINFLLVTLNSFSCTLNIKSDVTISIIDSGCLKPVFTSFFLAFLFHTLFFIKSNRSKILLTIISFVLLTIYSSFEYLNIIISVYRDYLPPSNGSLIKEIFWILIFYIAYFLSCWLLSPIKRKTNF